MECNRFKTKSKKKITDGDGILYVVTSERNDETYIKHNHGKWCGYFPKCGFCMNALHIFNFKKAEVIKTKLKGDRGQIFKLVMNFVSLFVGFEI